MPDQGDEHHWKEVLDFRELCFKVVWVMEAKEGGDENLFYIARIQMMRWLIHQDLFREHHLLQAKLGKFSEISMCGLICHKTLLH